MFSCLPSSPNVFASRVYISLHLNPFFVDHGLDECPENRWPLFLWSFTSPLGDEEEKSWEWGSFPRCNPARHTIHQMVIITSVSRTSANCSLSSGLPPSVIESRGPHAPGESNRSFWMHLNLSCNVASDPSFNNFKIHFWLISIYFIESTAEEMSWTIRPNRFVYIFFYCPTEWILSPLQKRRRIYFQSTRIAFSRNDPIGSVKRSTIWSGQFESNQIDGKCMLTIDWVQKIWAVQNPNPMDSKPYDSNQSTELYMKYWSIDSTQLNWLESITLWNVSIAQFLKIKQCSNRGIINLWLQISNQSVLNGSFF